MYSFALEVMDYFRKKARRGSPSGSSTGSAEDSGRDSKTASKKDKAKKKEGKSSLKGKNKKGGVTYVERSQYPQGDGEPDIGRLTIQGTMGGEHLVKVQSAPSSLMVPTPNRIRSSSFDTSQLRHGESDNTLQVPSNSRRSASFDAAYNMGSSDEGASDREASPSSSFMKFHKYYRRRPLDIPKLCIHCIHMEALSSNEGSPASVLGQSFEYDNVSVSGVSQSSGSEWDDNLDDDDEHFSVRHRILGQTKGITLSVTPSDSDDALVPIDPSVLEQTNWDDEGVITLQVPILKPRSSSLDTAYLQAGMEERRASLDLLDVPKQPRSSSVDVNLPTEESGQQYTALPSGTQRNRKAISKSCQDATDLLHPKHAESGYKRREIRSTVDWSDNAVSGDHTWVDTSASSDFCYVGEAECVMGKAKSSQRKKCAACRIYVHTCCMGQLDRINFKCKPSFREAGPRNYREPLFMRHHWVHRRRQEGKCKQCGKSFQQRFSFQAKEIIAISCSWCKTAYHNKISCFMMQQIEEQCTLGIHSSIIIPPAWIIKMPRKGSFKSSIRKKKKASLKKRKSRDDHRPFMIKPIPSPHMKPLVVFINPKSGGNQGAKLITKFQWLLNPRQVFDLSQEGPRAGLELFKKVPNLRILACGGDGTAGWILSTIDSLAIHPPPPVAVLPLGTGNDLARTLNWGGGYTDEPISKILCSVEDGPVVQLDRFHINVDPTIPSRALTDQHSEEKGVTKLPLDIMNNYFSLGSDAAVAVEFHESREANPEKFNSRLKNKIFYAGAGGKDLLKRSWKDLADHITVVCDGEDITPKIRELKLHCLLFLNIPKYAAGTAPWGSPSAGSNFGAQRHDDGCLEVIGLTTASMAALHVGGHGERLHQCQRVQLITRKTIPMQVDGEPCRLLPSKISISLRNQANMIQKPKRRGSLPIGNEAQQHMERLRIQVSRISMADYEALHYDKDKLREASVPLGIIVVEHDADLEQVRQSINHFHENNVKELGKKAPQLSQNWCFVDSTTAERFFRIDRAQEHLHYVSDISCEDLYIMDPELNASFLPASSQAMLPPAEDLSPPEAPIMLHHTLEGCVPLVVTPPAPGSPPPIRRLNGSAHAAPQNKFDFSLPVTPPRTPGEGQEAEEKTGSPVLETNIDGDEMAPLDRSQPDSPVSPRLRAKHTYMGGQHPPNGAHSGGDVVNAMGASFDSIYLDAAKHGDLNRIRDLVRRGARILATDQSGMTALHHAAKYGHRDVVKYLLDEAPSVILDMVDSDMGQTALHKAAANQRRAVCHLLVAKGASLTKKDLQGKTARLNALSADDRELASYLETQEHFQRVVAEDQETAV